MSLSFLFLQNSSMNIAGKNEDCGKETEKKKSDSEKGTIEIIIAKDT